MTSQRAELFPSGWMAPTSVIATPQASWLDAWTAPKRSPLLGEALSGRGCHEHVRQSQGSNIFR
eukprot:CAMPEP_0206510206 /NCGR_PEP_ID=MMETSP0324_2-20121206/59485_1 /ASSEMBLY_ACC=CAM_ASM_000836 /TAXON_ID=2866 /ORGANISM="Crypthecodinium cohnii, Strain Seligo" /LENGTH=63 /DNA_ID=CAMNT_0054001607 /DNA_START=34 /DNA_END=223 /DNA_ORIENTATION=-